METPALSRKVLVAYLCPACRSAQGIDLVKFSREQRTACTSCGRRLSREQVSRAIERSRAAAAQAP